MDRERHVDGHVAPLESTAQNRELQDAFRRRAHIPINSVRLRTNELEALSDSQRRIAASVAAERRDVNSLRGPLARLVSISAWATAARVGFELAVPMAESNASERNRPVQLGRCRPGGRIFMLRGPTSGRSLRPTPGAASLLRHR